MTPAFKRWLAVDAIAALDGAIGSQLAGATWWAIAAYGAWCVLTGVVAGAWGWHRWPDPRPPTTFRGMTNPEVFERRPQG